MKCSSTYIWDEEDDQCDIVVTARHSQTFFETSISRVLAALYTYNTYVYQGSLLDFRVADVCLQTMKISVIARFA